MPMDITVSIVIERPIEAVFDYVSNYEQDPEWRAGIIEMTQVPPGQPRIGTKTREVGRFFGRKLITPGEVTAYEPNRRIAFAGLMANTTRVSGSRAVAPAGTHTRFTYRAMVEPTGFYRLVAPLMAASLRRRFAGDLNCLKVQLEVGAARLAERTDPR